MMKKSKIESADESFETTFISLMLLLFCFMVIMVSLAQLEEPKFRKAIGSVRGAFSLLREAKQTSMVADGGPGVLREHKGASPEEEARRLKQTLDAVLGGMSEEFVRVEAKYPGFVVTLGSLLLYEPGHAHLKPDVDPVLGALSDFLSEWPGRVTVVGHTCNLPISNSTFASNWDLSVARAVEVLRRLEAGGVEPTRLAAVGKGDSSPLAGNDSEEHRRLNRRVEIILESDEGSEGDTPGGGQSRVNP